MNIRDRKHAAPAIEAREWQAQERALQEERTGLPPGDADSDGYRLVARALRQAPVAEGLPSNFAYEVARLAALRAPREVDTRLEAWLLRGLVGVMLLAGAVFAALQGPRWVAAGATLLDTAGASGAAPWVGLVCGCVAMSFALDWSRRALDRRDFHHGH